MPTSSLSSPNTGSHAGHRHPFHIPRKQQLVGHVATHRNCDTMQKGSASSLAGRGWGSDPTTPKAQMFVSSPLLPLKHVLDTH